MVVKRACPCSSRLTPLGAPIGFSGAFSRVGASVFSAQAFSDSEGRRPSKTSEIGVSTTGGLEGDFLLAIGSPCLTFDDKEPVSGSKVPKLFPTGWLVGANTFRDVPNTAA